MLNQTSWHRSPLVVFLVAILAALLTTLWLLGSSVGADRVLAPRASDYPVTENFQLDAQIPVRRSSLRKLKSRSQDILRWDSWGSESANQGKLVSPSFKAPPILSLYVAGWPNVPGNRLYLEQVDTGEQQDLKIGNIGGRWEEIQWWLPRSWQGQPVRLVAIDGNADAAGWMGVSSPIQTSLSHFLGSQVKRLDMVPLYTLQFALFLVVGLVPAIVLVQHWCLHPALILMLTITVSALVGYLNFWVYFFNHIAGAVFSVMVLLLSIGQTVRLSRREGFKRIALSVDLGFPVALMFLVGLLYTTVLYSIHPGEAPDTLPQLRFFPIFPPDNLLPKIFADRLYEGVDPRPLLGEWLSSDRPPLQTGMVLLQYPLIKLLGVQGGLGYQLLSTIAQCSWVAALWCLCRILGCTGWQIAIVNTFAIVSSLFFFHSIYVWPKLIAGSLVVFGFVLLVQSVFETRRPTTVEIILATTATGLGMLAHGGVVFAIPAIALMVLLRPRCFPHIQQIVLSCLIFAILLAPWGAYQKLYEPPGNRLVKWHIAGVVEIDPRPTGQAIMESYQSLSLTQIAANKWENVKTILGSLPRPGEPPAVVREHEFFSFIRSLGVLNLGWVLLPIFFRSKRFHCGVERKHIGTLFAVGVGGLVFWIFAMFGPATTGVQSASFATIMILFTGLAVLLTGLPRRVVYGLLAFQGAVFKFNWIIATTFIAPNQFMVAPDLLMLVTSAIATGLLSSLLYKLSRSPTFPVHLALAQE
ncbi:hypothetical protein J5X98_02945 [Leptothermofonsia sichuanensis E412]|uniref:hypothetical protein n=1 Tax=Leptothermofonsia sichuanensis TaxID=2917832 RepID=UPI001CA607AD|nr:hypothetical protein [Leptothermofonsia sichuanensis]QZZ21444.1 hypothetical protein J5X98_02945 [Leptothermofonsia sichuanensis E412]